MDDLRGLAPEGWRIPTDEEWTQLINYLGGNKLAGKKMKSTSGWSSQGNGTNESGFMGIPSGMRHVYGSFADRGYYTVWWSSTFSNPNNAWCISLASYSVDVLRGPGPNRNGVSVRCIKD